MADAELFFGGLTAQDKNLAYMVNGGGLGVYTEGYKMAMWGLQ